MGKKGISRLLVRLGGLHTILAFLKAIGKHIDSSGILEAWVETNVLGPKAANNVSLMHVVSEHTS